MQSTQVTCLGYKVSISVRKYSVRYVPALHTGLPVGYKSPNGRDRSTTVNKSAEKVKQARPFLCLARSLDGKGTAGRQWRHSSVGKEQQVLGRQPQAQRYATLSLVQPLCWHGAALGQEDPTDS